MPLNATRQIALTQNASVLIAPADGFRKCIGFGNIDDTNIQYVSNVITDANNGWPIMPRAEIVFSDATDKIDVRQPWYAYTTGAGQVINVIEAFYEPITPSAISTKVRQIKPPGKA